jgi:hypothetical protein
MELFSSIEVARIAGVPEHRLAYALRAGKLSPPAFLVAGKKVFTEDDCRRVRDYFAQRGPWKRARRNDER